MNGQQSQTIKHKCNQPHLIIQSLAVPTVMCIIAEEWRDTDSSATLFHRNPPKPDMKVQKKGI